MKVTELKAENPYVGPRPFEERHQRRFFGRDWEADELVSLVVAHPAVLLYAQSGAGKTSLINAKLIPLLRDEESLQVMPVARVRGEVPEEVQPEQIENLFVFNTLLGWIESEADPAQLMGLSLSAFLIGEAGGWPRPKDEEGQPTLRVVIFDQFEELFTLYPERWTEREEFFAQVADALSEDPFLRVLFVLREDYLAQLDPYVALLPERLRTRFRLERLRQEAALAAVKGPLMDTERSFAPGVAESLVEELLKIRVETRVGKAVEVAGEFVEPVQLQVVCRSLWEELSPGITEITLEHLRIFGDVDQALLGFYERALSSAVQQAKVREGGLRAWFERDLITPMGTRGTVFRGAKSTGGVPNTAIDALEGQHLIRAERRAGARWYELTHDRFIGPIQRSNEAWRAARRERWLRIGGGVAVVLALLFVGITALQGIVSRQEVVQAQATAIVAAAEVSEVKATAEVVAAELSKAKALRPGISVGGVNSTADTIGCFVMDTDGEVYLLSTAVVLGSPDYELGSPVVQPGPIDGGKAPDDVVGYFAKYLPLYDGVSVANLIGLARLEEGIKFETAIPGIGPIRGVRNPVVGSTVHMLGRTTGLTTTQITRIDATFSMASPRPDDKGKTLRFRDGIYCSLISGAGDGGALVVDEEGYAIGIVVGGGGTETVLAPMQKVLESLDVQLLHSGAVRVLEKDNSEMVYVPAGEFTMGSDDSNSLADEDEKPQHSVYLDAFWIDRTEVTNAAFARFVEETGYQTEAEKAGEAGWRAYAKGKENHPVVKVTWNDADAYCWWAGKRLPTEAEWEKAAKGEEGFIYPWGNEWDPAKANTKEGGLRGTVAVGSFPEGASPYGVPDMAGNVWEWTDDWYQSYPDSTYQSEDFGEIFKVTRGGGWSQGADLVTTSNRSATAPTAANDDLGFRCGPERPLIAEVDLWLAEGCDREYEPGFLTQIFFRTGVDGWVAVWLDEQELLFEREVVGGTTYVEDWQVVEEPGEHRLIAVLDLEDREVIHECWFSVTVAELTPQEKIAQLQKEAQELHQQLAASRTTVAQLQQEVQGLRQQVDTLRQQLVAATTTNPTLTPTPTATPTSTPSPTWTPTVSIPITRTIEITGGVKVQMVYVPAGEFLRGTSDEEVEKYARDYGWGRKWFSDEQPQKPITLDAFWIDMTEVTNEQFEQFVQDTGHEPGTGNIWNKDSGKFEPDPEVNWRHPQGPDDDLSNKADHPVVQVSWADAEAYCRWRGARLPTETEWEKAAGWDEEQKRKRIWPWGDDFPTGKKLNYCDVNCIAGWKDITIDDRFETTAPVGSYSEGASPYGVLDMSGNVWEWVADYYDKGYYEVSPPVNPLGPVADTGWRVLRGTSWVQGYREEGRVASRFFAAPDTRNFDIGFRCAQSP